MWQLLRGKWDAPGFISELRETSYCHVFFPKMEEVLHLHRRDLRSDDLYYKIKRSEALTTAETRVAECAVQRHKFFTQETIKAELGFWKRAWFWMKSM